MHIAESQDAGQGVFVDDPHEELTLWLAHLFYHDPVDAFLVPTEEMEYPDELLASDAPPVEDVAVLMADLSVCIERMTSIQRTVLYNLLCGWKVSAIANRLGLPCSRVTECRNEAVALLREYYRNGDT